MISPVTPDNPSSGEIQNVANKISCLELRRENLVRELSDIDLQLRNERATYNSLLNGQTSVSRIPFELLSSIFLLCQSAGPPKPYYSFAVAASHVSRHWRTVCLSTPLLWNDINLRMKSSPATLARLNVHLTRSEDCFLNIYIYTPLRDIDPILTLLAYHCQRWRRLSMITDYDHLDAIYTCLRDSSTPKLEHLSLQIGIPEQNSPRSKYPGNCPRILLRGAPSLKFVRLGGRALGNLAPPSEMISTLDLDGFEKYYMEPSQFVALLETLPSLVNLSLGQLHIHHPRDPSDITSQIKLPRLRSLRISGPCTSPHLALSHLVLPHLESLTLHELDSFHSPSLPSVRELTIESCSFDANAAMNLLQACPSITDLTMDFANSTICSVMTIPMDMVESDIPWPLVHTLTIRELEVSDLARFRIMIYTRISLNRPFHKLRVDRRSRTVLRNKLCLDWFKEQMAVENCDQPDSWPADLGYHDPAGY